MKFQPTTRRGGCISISTTPAAISDVVSFRLETQTLKIHLPLSIFLSRYLHCERIILGLDSIHFLIASESHSPAMPPIIPINRTSENSIWVLRIRLCSSSSSGSVSGRTGSGPRSAVTVNNHSDELSVESSPAKET